MNYCTTRRELLAVVRAVKHFRPYLYGRKFLVRTDHASLTWLMSQREPEGQVARWLEILSEMTFEIRHRPGKAHGNADGLSRRGCPPNCRQCVKIGFAEDAEAGGTTVQISKVTASSNTNELADRQREDPGSLGAVYAWVKQGVTPSEAETAMYPMDMRRYREVWGNLQVGSDGVLRLREVRSESEIFTTVAPPGWRADLVWSEHKRDHAGAQRTSLRVRRDWFWPRLRTDVKELLRTCEVCQRSKKDRPTKFQGQRHLYSGRPWQRLAVDLVGPMPKTPRGNHQILVVSDHFTRWAHAVAIPDGTAATVARALVEHVFCPWGLPEVLHSDQGAQFESTLMAEVCFLLGIDRSHTTPYHPQGNGVVERNNRTLGDSLRCKLLARTEDDWDLVLPIVMAAYRATPHSTTGYTPNEMTMGRDLRTTATSMRPPPLPTDGEVDQAEYVTGLRQALETAWEVVRTDQEAVQAEHRPEPMLFKAGDKVLMRNYRRKKGASGKLAVPYVGPYDVIECYPNHTYLLRQGETDFVQNEIRLKLFRPANQAMGQAPMEDEPHRRPLGQYRRPRPRPVPEPPAVRRDRDLPPNQDSLPPELEQPPEAEAMEQPDLPSEQSPPTARMSPEEISDSVITDEPLRRSARLRAHRPTRLADRVDLGDYEMEAILVNLLPILTEMMASRGGGMLPATAGERGYKSQPPDGDRGELPAAAGERGRVMAPRQDDDRAMETGESISASTTGRG